MGQTEENELISIVKSGLHGHIETTEDLQINDAKLLAWSELIRFIL
jgi:hypothetical protein